MLDIFDRIERDSGGPIGQYFNQGFGYYMYPKLEGELGPHMTFNGKEVLNWSLNNYLGLANHPEVRKADAEGAAKWGLAYPMGSRMLSGHTASMNIRKLYFFLSSTIWSSPRSTALPPVTM